MTSIEGKLNELEEKIPSESGDSPANVSVTWRGAAPDERPEGMEFDAESGVLYYDAWDAQQRTLDALEAGEHDVVVYRGGYGSGKSVLGARATIEVALEVEDAHCLVLAQDFSKGEGTTFDVLFDALPGGNTVDKGGRHGDPENSPIVSDYNRNRKVLTLYNGSRIRLGSADEWNRYAGAEFNFVWCDEVAHYDPSIHKLAEMLLSRLRTRSGPNVTLWTSTGNGYNDFYDFVERQVGPDDEPIPTTIHNVVADTRDNPYAEKELLVRQFEGTGKEAQALAGGFAAAQGRVYSQFSRETHVLPHEEALDALDDEQARNRGWRVYGYDAGWSDPRVILEIGKSPMGQLIVVDEWVESETHVEDAISWMKRRNKPHGTIYCEHEPTDIEKFKRAGWRAEKAEKSLDAGISEVRRRLRCDHEGNPGLLVSGRCETLIREFLDYSEEEVGTGAAEDHCLDSLRYAIMGYENQPALSTGVAFG